MLQHILSVYNVLGLLVSFFLASKTTPTHIFYEYSMIIISIRFYRHIPFFWDLIFYSCFVFSFYGLFTIFGELSNSLYLPDVSSGFMPYLSTKLRVLFRLFFDLKLHKSHKISSQLLRLLNCLLALVVWSFIKFYRSERDYYHNLILAHQERTDMDYLKKHCLKI